MNHLVEGRFRNDTFCRSTLQFEDVKPRITITILFVTKQFLNAIFDFFSQKTIYQYMYINN